MHRFSWHLRHAGPWDEDADRSGRNGPMVAPGTYRARLTVGDWSQTVSFAVQLDPRVASEGVVSEQDIGQQVELALRARDVLSDARLASARLERALESATPTARAELEGIRDDLVTDSRRYSQPMLIDQLSYLYGNLDHADQRVGKDAVDRYETLKRELDELVGRLERLLGSGESGDGP
jgi:hypothetical protein